VTLPNLRPIRVRGAGGPNPSKIGMVLEELGIAYEIVNVFFTDV
jgi:glutathione S-transferase